MRKTALTLTVSTLVLGIFGAFLHWLWTLNAIDPETGYLVRGAGTTVVFILYSAVAVAAILALNLFWLRGFEKAPDAGKALHCERIYPLVIAWVLCAAIAASSCLLLFSAGHSRYPLWQRLFGAFGILAGLSVPLLFGKKGAAAGAMGSGAACVVTLFYCFWLLFGYKSHSSEPVIWSFALEILAVAAAAVALYQVTRYYYGVGSGTRTMIMVQLGVYLNIATLFEQRSTAWNVLLGATAALLLLFEFLLIENMWEKRDGD